MEKKQRAELKKEIRKIFREFKVETEYSTHSELAEFILNEFEDYEKANKRIG